MKNENRFVLWTLFASGLFAIVDIISDIREGAEWSHLFVELAITGLTVASVTVLWRRKRRLDEELKLQKILLERAESLRQQADHESAAWREETASVLKGLSEAIDAQLTRWQLTIAEKEVALLLLKGLSLKEIAEIRQVSEKTARAQSFAVYSKSGLTGRAQLSAFFLEDLMVPFEKARPNFAN